MTYMWRSAVWGLVDCASARGAASVLLCGDAGPALTEYVERDVAHQYGSATFVASVVEDLGGTRAVAADDQDRQALASMLVVARRLRSALSDV
jgi:hypothetical protein